MTYKLGILLPQSNLFSASQDFIAGLKLGVKNLNNFTLYVESTGFNKKDVLAEKINKLKLQEGVEFITGISHWRPFIDQSNLFEQNRVPILFNDIGANLPLPQPLSKYVYTNSLNLWQSTFALGKYVTEKVGKRILLLSHFYDGGYHTPYALAKGVQAGGGFFLPPFSVQDGYDANILNQLKSHIQQVNPDAIVCQYTNPRHHILLDWLQSKDSEVNLPIFSTPHWLDDFFLEQGKVDSAVGIQSCTTWNRSLKNPINQNFIKKFENEEECLTTPFAVLGYESGIIIREAIESLGDKWSKQKYFQEFMNEIKLEGPRNEYYWDKDLQCSFSNSYLNSVENKDNEWQNIISKQLSTEGTLEIFEELYQSLNTGWDNTYLCV